MSISSEKRAPDLATVWRERPLHAVLLALACGPAPAQESPTSLVLITVDTLRADHLGSYGYFRATSPVLDGLASDALLFESAYSPIATTLPSHISLFTGLNPIEHGVLANTANGGRAFLENDEVELFARMASESGYRTAAFVSATPLKRATGMAAGFETFDEPARQQRRAGKTLEPCLQWLRSDVQSPFFLWVHLFDPHTPYAPPRSHALFSRDAGLEAVLAERGYPPPARRSRELDPSTLIDAYDGEVHYADAQIGVLFEALRALGLWDETVIAVLGDHGEGLHQHGWPAHGGIYGEQLRVPFIVRFPQPGGPRGRVTALVSLVDVLPTLLPRIDARLATRFARQASGVDVLDDVFRERPLLGQRTQQELRYAKGPMFALTTQSWRYHYQPELGDRLFDRAQDPFELENLLNVQPDIAAELRDLTLTEIERQRERARVLGLAISEAGPELTPELLRELEQLGYAGDDGSD